MQVILLEKVANLGELGDVVKVQGRLRAQLPDPAGQGEARDAGEPEGVRGSAAPSSRRRRPSSSPQAQERGAKLDGLTVQITQKAGVDGKLFGSVTNADIVEALKRRASRCRRRAIRMPQGPLKHVGEHPLKVALHTDVRRHDHGVGARRAVTRSEQRRLHEA